MNTKQCSLRITSAVIFLFTLLSGSSAVLAQVKIGTNPTTINAANNLEVEASTAGRSVSVDKTTGKVKIADGSQAINYVLTSDANGVATWQKVGTSNITPLPKGKMAGALTTWLVPGVETDVAFSSLPISEGGVVKVGNGIQVPIAGNYLIHSASVITSRTGNPGVTSCNGSSTSNSYTLLLVNGSGITAANDKVTQRWDQNSTLHITTLLYLNANDVITLKTRNNIYNDSDGACGTYLSSGDISVIYQP
ncbi:hypothetical protein [Dyadobacter frigoris]|uniref:Uncharacterized protein n=1 Tax=Dyadobacter frigoris TaxID=2576211 RepID=A0A4U6D1C7_9BACT|nr:hypothetical protein [Dyadobacter frigoris]TKT91019.1 hypothetical protein FDK13_18875 [Dyadobacter frigoris]GLU56213.1 hypothetical protein Dfri01_56740 [Dyadobacter frigoris]